MPGDGALVKSRGFSGFSLQWRSGTAVGILRAYQERPMTGGWFWGFRHHVKALGWPEVHVLLNFVLQPPWGRRWKRDPFCEPSLLIGRWAGRILFCFIRMPPPPTPPPGGLAGNKPLMLHAGCSPVKRRSTDELHYLPFLLHRLAGSPASIFFSSPRLVAPWISYIGRNESVELWDPPLITRNFYFFFCKYFSVSSEIISRNATSSLQRPQTWRQHI